MSGVVLPKNDLTRMIELVARRNAAGVAGVPLVSGEPLPSVRSASLGEIVDAADAGTDQPLSAEEIAVLNQQAIAAGIRDERLGNAGAAPEGNYESLEAALAAGAPVRSPVFDPPVVRHRGGSMQTHVQQTNAPAQARMPNFQNVQGIDLIEGVVYVDDMSFKIPKEDLSQFRQYVIEIARGSIMKDLEEALRLFTQETAEAENGGDAPSPDAGVQQINEGSGAEPSV